METVSGQRATLRRREGARGRHERRLRAEARIRLQLCRDAVRIASHRGGDGGEARVALHGHVPDAPLPQGWVLRHVVGHLPVPALDVPRRSCRDTQLVEQLVEVPTILSYSSLLQRTVEQHVDIPVPGGGGPSSGLQGFSSGQRSTASPSSKKRFSERIVEQIVDPLSSGRLQGSSSYHSPAGDEECADESGKGFFRTCPQNKKKCEVGLALGVGTALRVEPINAGCSAGGLRRVGAAQRRELWQALLLEQTQ